MNRNFGYSRTYGGVDRGVRNGVGRVAFVPAEDGDNLCPSGNGCGAKDTVYGVKGRPVGSVYAPVQNFDDLYDLGKALSRGTIFADLDLPLVVAGNGRGCNGCNGGVRRG